MENVAQQINEHLGVDSALFRKQLKGDSSWNELANGIEPNIRNQIANCSLMCHDTSVLVEEEGLDNAEFKAMAYGIMRDLKGYADNFNSLIARREGRTGRIDNPSEYTDYMSVGMEMTSLSEQLQTVVGHALIGLTEHHHAALEKRRERENANSAVTDVTDIREVPTEATPAEDLAVSTGTFDSFSATATE